MNQKFSTLLTTALDRLVEVAAEFGEAETPTQVQQVMPRLQAARSALENAIEKEVGAALFAARK